MLSRDELVRVVTADLAYLLEEWDEQIDDDSLRRNSSVLRRLLVDNELQRAWKAAGFVKEPHIVTSTLTHTVGRLSRDLIAFASAGGAKFNGMEMRGVFIGKKAMTPDELLQLRGGAMPAEELLGLRAFVESPCMVIEGAVVIRRVLIKYVSNKLGGAHFDRTRGFSQEEIAFRRLDSVGSTLRLADKNAIYFELLSIGQALARERMTSVCFATKSRPIRAEVLVNARWVPRAFRKAVALQAEIRRPGGLTKTVFPSSANVDGIGGSHHCPARCRAE